jgi:hypothetical protein
MEEASAGSMKPGYGALVPMAAGFLRWNAILPSGQNAGLCKRLRANGPSAGGALRPPSRGMPGATRHDV